VRSVAAESAGLDTLLEKGPALVAAELVPGHSDRVIELARRLRTVSTTHRIPFVVYGRYLGSGEIERMVRHGALWLQLAPSDSAKLVAAVRGVLAAWFPRPMSMDPCSGQGAGTLHVPATHRMNDLRSGMLRVGARFDLAHASTTGSTTNVCTVTENEVSSAVRPSSKQDP